jgi:cytoskeletal protein CcmA (bactofilin family)
MFNSNRNAKGDSKVLPAASNANVIGGGTVIQGDVACEGDIRIDGLVNGLVSTKAKIVVGPEGEIKGDLVCQSAEILGKVTGIIKVSELLFLKGNAAVKGDVYTAHFEMEPTAKFNGRCYMEPDEAPAEGLNGKHEKSFIREEAAAEGA